MPLPCSGAAYANVAFCASESTLRFCHTLHGWYQSQSQSICRCRIGVPLSAAGVEHVPNDIQVDCEISDDVQTTVVSL